MTDVGVQTQPDEEYYRTAAGQTIANSWRYLRAAELLRFSEHWEEYPDTLQLPTLHLIAHGVELLLKFPLLRDGITPDVIRSSYGHDLGTLWEAAENVRLRDLVLDQARSAWEQAKASGKWPDDLSEDPHAVLLAALERLRWLHGRESGFALRYLVGPNTLAPRPAFLIEAFRPVAEELARNPTILDCT